jgi:putative transposase
VATIVATIFFREDDDAQTRGWLAEAAEAQGFRVKAAASWLPHPHLSLHDPSRPSLGHAGTRGQSAARDAIVRARRHGRTINTAWHQSETHRKGRTRAAPIDSEACLLACCRHVALNPVRARMVRHPRDGGWSRFTALAEALVQPVFGISALLRTHNTRYLRLVERLQ